MGFAWVLVLWREGWIAARRMLGGVIFLPDGNLVMAFEILFCLTWPCRVLRDEEKLVVH